MISFKACEFIGDGKNYLEMRCKECNRVELNNCIFNGIEIHKKREVGSSIMGANIGSIIAYTMTRSLGYGGMISISSTNIVNITNNTFDKCVSDDEYVEHRYDDLYFINSKDNPKANITNNNFIECKVIR